MEPMTANAGVPIDEARAVATPSGQTALSLWAGMAICIGSKRRIPAGVFPARH